MHISLVKPTCFSSVLQRFIREKWLEFFQRQLSLASRLASHTALDYATNVENVVYYNYLSKCIYFIIAGAMCKCLTIGKCLCTMTEVVYIDTYYFFPNFWAKLIPVCLSGSNSIPGAVVLTLQILDLDKKDAR